MSKIRQLASQTVLYGLGSIVPRFLNFALVPFHTEFFRAEEYGIITNMFALAGVLNVVYLMGMETAYFRFANKDIDERQVFRLTTTVILLTGIPVSLIMLVFPGFVGSLIQASGSELYIQYIALILLIDAVVAIPFARLRFRNKAIAFAVSKILNVAVLVGLNVIFLTQVESVSLRLQLVFVANLLANALFLVIFYRDLLDFRFSWDREISPKITRYGFPVMITGLAGMTNEMFSRITIGMWLPAGFYVGKSAASIQGIFGACYKLAIIMNLAIQAFRYAAEPFFFQNSRDKASGELFARVNHYFILTCSLILLAVSLNLDVIKYVIRRPEYWAGLDIVPLLLLAYLLLGVYYNLTVWFKVTDKTHVGTLITIGGALITIAANYFFIPVWGMIGSGLAAVLCYLAMVISCYLLGQKYYPIPYKVGPALGWIAGTVALIYLVLAWKIANPYLSFLVHQLVILCYLGLILWSERKELPLPFLKKYKPS